MSKLEFIKPVVTFDLSMSSPEAQPGNPSSTAQGVEQSKLTLPKGTSISIQSTPQTVDPHSPETHLISTFVAANNSTQYQKAKHSSQQSIQPHHEPQLQVKISSENITVEKNNGEDPRQKEPNEKLINQKKPEKSAQPPNEIANTYYKKMPEAEAAKIRLASMFLASLAAAQTTSYTTTDQDHIKLQFETLKKDKNSKDPNDEDQNEENKKKKKSMKKLYLVLSLISFLGAKSKTRNFKENLSSKLKKVKKV